ncbi:hypothetical protein E0L36_02380 [Streptomyces sp. AJS327]|nr:hypothetical protein [Streptomyces sp. AJS327]
MLELSWDGFIVHIQQGWNIGKPPYGYLAERFPHPVPTRRAQGDTKHRLVPDPVCGPVVTEIFNLRVIDSLSYRGIADHLNQDVDRYPPPRPSRAGTTAGHWTASAVRSILENPKYTGYQVWNRRARKTGNKVNPISEWIWSPHPTHEALVTLTQFDAAWPIIRPHSGIRKREEVPRKGRSVSREYTLRSYIRCALCGKRMYGKFSKSRTYYSCQPKKDHHADADWYATHPHAIWISERALLEAIHAFFEERIFGPNRAQLLATQLSEAEATPAPPGIDIGALREKEARLAQAKQRLMDQLTEGDDEGDPEFTAEFRRGIRRQFDQLERQRRAVRSKIDGAEVVVGAHQGGDTALLDAIPRLRSRMRDLPVAIQRGIYDAFRLHVRYDHRGRRAEIHVTIAATLADGLPEIMGSGTARSEPGGTQPFVACPRQDSNLRPSA